MFETDRFYTVRETATLLRVSAATIHRLIASGRLHASRVGRSVRIAGGSLDAAIRATVRDSGGQRNAR